MRFVQPVESRALIGVRPDTTRVRGYGREGFVRDSGGAQEHLLVGHQEGNKYYLSAWRILTDCLAGAPQAREAVSS